MLAANPRFVAVRSPARFSTPPASRSSAPGSSSWCWAARGDQALRLLAGLPCCVQEQASVAGASTRPDVNQLVARVGNIVFGPGFAWLKLDLDTVVDFAADQGRLFGKLEAGRLLVGRIGMFMRAGTQLLGTRQVDYSLEAGVRYLFRLGR